ncbi:MAG: hypothetical protein ACI9TH_000005 [Kiritimatiellia bacterium]|jgi:hypothetical protein
MTQEGDNPAGLRLQLLMGLHLSTLEKYKQLDEVHDRERRQRMRTLESRLAEMPAATSWPVQSELEGLRHPSEIPLTFGLYFPDHLPEPCAPFSGMTHPFISAVMVTALDAEALTSLGAVVRSTKGMYHTAFIPFECLPELVAHPAVYALELARPSLPMIDITFPFLDAESGQLALMAVLKTDYDLPRQLEEEVNLNRIPRMWDQTLPDDTGRFNAPYGREFRMPECTRPGQPGLAFVRVMPPATYLKTDNTFLLDGVHYLATYAKERGLTCDCRRCLFHLENLVDQSPASRAFIQSMFNAVEFQPPKAAENRSATDDQAKVDSTYERPADASPSRRSFVSSNIDNIASNSG